MSKTQDMTLDNMMSSLVPIQWLKEQAKFYQVVQRQRRVHIEDFVWVLIMAFGTGTDLSLASLRARFNLHTGCDLAQSSFNERFNKHSAALMHAVVRHLLKHVDQQLPKPDSKWLQCFSNIIAVDSTVIAVDDRLSDLYRCSNEGQAKIKLHAAYNLVHGLPLQFDLTGACVHDGKMPWTQAAEHRRGSMLLCDLGYYNFRAFTNLTRNGVWFVTRFKSHFNPLITDVYNESDKHRGGLIGKTLEQALKTVSQSVLDVKVQCKVKHKLKRRGKKTRAKTMTHNFRLVMLYNEKEGKHYGYLTNLPATITAHQIWALYRLRWQVELLFKTLKSDGGALHKIPGRRKAVVETLLWAAVAKVLISRITLRCVKKAVGVTARHIPAMRWDRRLKQLVSPLLNRLVMRRYPPTNRDLLDFMLLHAYDPNRKRRTPLYSISIC